jgi:hypothetical protein
MRNIEIGEHEELHVYLVEKLITQSRKGLGLPVSGAESYPERCTTAVEVLMTSEVRLDKNEFDTRKQESKRNRT